MLYSGFNTLPRSVFWSADLNGRSDNTDVILPNFPIGSTLLEKFVCSVFSQGHFLEAGLVPFSQSLQDY